MDRFYTCGGKPNGQHAWAMIDGEMCLYCPKCDDYYNPNEFHKQNTTNRGYSPYCKLCTREVNEEYRKKQKVGGREPSPPNALGYESGRK